MVNMYSRWRTWLNVKVPFPMQTGNGLDSPSTYEVGQVHYGSIWFRLAATHGSGPAWPWPESPRALRNKQKTSRKSNFLLRGLAHGPEIYSFDAPFMATHFPLRLVWCPNPTDLLSRNDRNYLYQNCYRTETSQKYVIRFPSQFWMKK